MHRKPLSVIASGSHKFGERGNLDFFLLLAGVLLYFAARFLTLWTAIENVSWPEELGVGTIAREIISGLKKSFWAYQIDVYAGESLIAALAAVPFFKLLGANLFALKISTLAFSALTVSLTAWFLNRHFGLKTALWAVFFLTFSPPAFTAHSLIPMNGHCEVLLASVLMLVFFYEFLFSQKRRLVFLCLFGVLAGFSFWFYYAAGIAVAACLIIWFCAERSSVFSRKGVLALFSFLIGFSPWFISNHINSFDSGRYLFGGFWGLQSKSLFWINERLWQQSFFSFPKSFSFLPPEHLLKDAAAYAYCLLFILAVFPFWRKKIFSAGFLRADNKKNIFFLLYPILFCYLYAVTNFIIPQDYPQGTVAFRYYTPLYFFGVMLLSLALGAGKAPRWILGALVLFSFGAQQTVFFKEHPGRGLRYNGYSYVEHGVRWQTVFDKKNPFPEMVRLASRFQEPQNRVFFGGLALGWEGGMQQPRPHSHLFEDEFLKQLPPSWQPHTAEVMASFLTFHEEKRAPEVLEISETLPPALRNYFFKGFFSDFSARASREFFQDKAALESLSPEARGWLFWGLGNNAGYRFLEEKSAAAPVLEEVRSSKPEEQKWFYRGLGASAFGTDQPTFFINTDYFREMSGVEKIIPEIFLDDFYWGAGWNIRMFFPADEMRARDWLARMPEPFRNSAAQGFEACRRWYGFE